MLIKLGRVSESTKQRTLAASGNLDGWKASPSMQPLYDGAGPPYNFAKVFG